MIKLKKLIAVALTCTALFMCVPSTAAFAAKYNGWEQTDGKWYFYKNGEAQTGWVQDGSKWYYMDPETKEMYTNRTLYAENSDRCYYFGSDGAMVRNKWVLHNNDIPFYRYYESSGLCATGWKKVSGKWYYFMPESYDGYYYAVPYGPFRIGSEVYFFKQSDQSLVSRKGWYSVKVYDGTYWWYVNSNGTCCSGWKKIRGKWYYFAPKSDGCVMTTGMLTIDDKMYYFTGSGTLVMNNWVQDKGKWYYASGDGSLLVSQWKYTGGYWYYFGNDGAMMHDCTTPDNYQLDSDGHIIK